MRYFVSLFITVCFLCMFVSAQFVSPSNPNRGAFETPPLQEQYEQQEDIWIVTGWGQESYWTPLLVVVRQYQFIPVLIIFFFLMVWNTYKNLFARPSIKKFLINTCIYLWVCLVLAVTIYFLLPLGIQALLI